MTDEAFDALPDFLTPDEVVSILRVGRSTLYRILASGELRSIRIGRTYRIPRVALREYIERKLGQTG